MNMKTVLITGGSEGIGKAFAEYFAREGYELILVAKNPLKLSDTKAELEKKYNQKIEIIAEDLSVKGSVSDLYQKLKGKKLDILINNAGLGYTGKSWEIPIDQEENMTMVNVTAMMSLCKYVLRDLVKRREGLIINVASTGAFQPGPYIAGYYASKSFVLQYTEAIHEEAKEFGVQVCALCPGPTDTAFYQKSGGKMSFFHMSPEKVVSYCMKHTNRKIIIPGFTNRLIRWIPVSVRVFFLKQMKKK